MCWRCVNIMSKTTSKRFFSVEETLQRVLDDSDDENDDFFNVHYVIMTSLLLLEKINLFNDIRRVLNLLLLNFMWQNIQIDGNNAQTSF